GLRSYPRYYPRHSCKHREGSTDLSRLNGQDRSWPGQCDLPDKELRYLRTVHVCYSTSRSGQVISAQLCMSPCRSDYIILRGTRASEVWRIVSEDSVRPDWSDGLSC